MNCARTRSLSRTAALAVLLLLAVPAVAADGIGLDPTRLGVLGEAISKDQDLISADQLARWIVEERRDYQLIDLRHEEAFRAGHIQGATHIPLRRLHDTATIAALPGHLAIVVYDDTGLRAAQVAAMLRLAGLDAYALLGGFEHWALHALNPEAAAAAASTHHRLDAARRDAIARALKQCDLPCPLPEPDPTQGGYTPPLAPVEQAPSEPAESSGGVLLDVGC